MEFPISDYTLVYNEQNKDDGLQKNEVRLVAVEQKKSSGLLIVFTLLLLLPGLAIISLLYRDVIFSCNGPFRKFC
jgi:hypothetical protein